MKRKGFPPLAVKAFFYFYLFDHKQRYLERCFEMGRKINPVFSSLFLTKSGRRRGGKIIEDVR